MQYAYDDTSPEKANIPQEVSARAHQMNHSAGLIIHELERYVDQSVAQAPSLSEDHVAAVIELASKAGFVGEATDVPEAA